MEKVTLIIIAINLILLLKMYSNIRILKHQNELFFDLFEQINEKFSKIEIKLDLNEKKIQNIKNNHIQSGINNFFFKKELIEKINDVIKKTIKK